MARELRRLLLPPGRLQSAAVTGVVALEASERHYLTRVLRLRAGEAFAVVDGAGHLWQANLEADAARLLQPLAQPLQLQVPASPPLQLAVALPRRDADVLLRMATELGIDVLQPLQTDRSVAERSNPQRLEAIVREAVEQCERLWTPALVAPISAQTLFGGAAGLRLLATTRRAGLVPLATVLEDHPLGDDALITLAIGPEGGWSPSEEATAIEAGWLPVGLGPTILRTSTAAVAAATLLVNWRDCGGGPRVSP